MHMNSCCIHFSLIKLGMKKNKIRHGHKISKDIKNENLKSKFCDSKSSSCCGKAMAIKCPSQCFWSVSASLPTCHPHRPSGPHSAHSELGRASLTDHRGDESLTGKLNSKAVRPPLLWLCLSPVAGSSCPGSAFLWNQIPCLIQETTRRAGTLFLKGLCIFVPRVLPRWEAPAL